jgi:hypothetical protein
LEGYVSWKDSPVHVDASPQCRSRLDVATRLARQFDAHLTAICVIPESLAVQNARTGWAPPNFVMQLDEIERERARNARILFETYMAGAKFEWREQEAAAGGRRQEDYGSIRATTAPGSAPIRPRSNSASAAAPPTREDASALTNPAPWLPR